MEEIFIKPKTDDKADNETDHKTNDETDDKQPHTTDMPDVESEESAEQRRHQEAQGLKILTPN